MTVATWLATFGFYEKERQVDVAGFFISLVLTGGTHEGGRRIDVLRTYLKQGYGRVERSAFYERFNHGCQVVLVTLLDRAIAAGQAQPKMLPGILSGVSDWRIFDSTTVRLPDGAYNEYPGCGSYAAIKVHDVTAGRGAVKVALRLVGVPTDKEYCFFPDQLVSRHIRPSAGGGSLPMSMGN